MSKAPIFVITEAEEPDAIELYGQSYTVRGVDALNGEQFAALMAIAPQVANLGDADAASVKTIEASFDAIIGVLVEGIEPGVLARLGFIQKQNLITAFLLALRGQTPQPPPESPPALPETPSTGARPSRASKRSTAAIKDSGGA